VLLHPTPPAALEHPQPSADIPPSFVQPTIPVPSIIPSFVPATRLRSELEDDDGRSRSRRSSSSSDVPSSAHSGTVIFSRSHFFPSSQRMLAYIQPQQQIPEPARDNGSTTTLPPPPQSIDPSNSPNNPGCVSQNQIRTPLYQYPLTSLPHSSTTLSHQKWRAPQRQRTRTATASPYQPPMARPPPQEWASCWGTARTNTASPSRECPCPARRCTTIRSSTARSLSGWSSRACGMWDTRASPLFSSLSLSLCRLGLWHLDWLFLFLCFTESQLPPSRQNRGIPWRLPRSQNFVCTY